jgi:hypothetical protein
LGGGITFRWIQRVIYKGRGVTFHNTVQFGEYFLKS